MGNVPSNCGPVGLLVAVSRLWRHSVSMSWRRTFCTTATAKRTTSEPITIHAVRKGHAERERRELVPNERIRIVSSSDEARTRVPCRVIAARVRNNERRRLEVVATLVHGACQISTRNAPLYKPGFQFLKPSFSTPARFISIGGGVNGRWEPLPPRRKRWVRAPIVKGF